MRTPAIRGLIDRRILLNYRVDPDVLARVLPAPFRPKVVRGFGVAGICLIRLKQIRPSMLPSWLGLSSENAAHRAAVEWDEGDVVREGVYIPRRDTNLRVNTLVGGRLFPGVHHHARFAVKESADRFEIGVRSDDMATEIAIRARRTERWPQSALFGSLTEASAFFQAGSIGYSKTSDPSRFEGLELNCSMLDIEPLEVDQARSSFFDDTARFPAGSIELDSAFLMRGIAHDWRSKQDLCCREEGLTPPDRAPGCRGPTERWRTSPAIQAGGA